jgi:hypothetical protein
VIRATSAVDQHVAGLEVAMNDAALMRGSQAFADVARHRQRFFG